MKEILNSWKGRAVVVAVLFYLLWQGWLSLSAPSKIAQSLPREGDKIDLVVTLPFPPERFHVLVFQRYGRVSGTQENSVEVRGVPREDLRTIARHYWVKKVEPLGRERS